MRPRRTRLLAAIAGLGAASFLAIPSASADLVDPGFRKIESRVLLHAGRFDDYCEHRRRVEKGDSFESIAEKAYGDRTRAAAIAAANPDLDPKNLVVGRKIVLPAKSTQPADAKETLAWTFWGFTSISGFLPLQRVYPDEPTDPTGSHFRLFAVPAADAPEVARLLEKAKARNPTAGGLWGEEVLAHFPSAVCEKGLVLETEVRFASPATESTTVVRIVELTAATKLPGRFVVENESVEFRDRNGAVVKAGFDLLFSWRGIPLGLIALAGAIGLARMRRAARLRQGRVLAAIIGFGAASTFPIHEASADLIPQGVKYVALRLCLKADRFDDYCDHCHVVVKGDSFESIARTFYGDRARAEEIAAANSEYEASRLPIGAKLVLPPKRAAPADSKETLAWTFWGSCGALGRPDLRRIYPDEISTLGVLTLVAVPAERVAEFEKVLERARAKPPKGLVRCAQLDLTEAPWAIRASGLRSGRDVDEHSSAVEKMITLRIVDLAAGGASEGRFEVKEESVELRDRDGKAVKAGLDLIASWRGLPLGLIAVIGAVGLVRMRQRRRDSLAP